MADMVYYPTFKYVDISDTKSEWLRILLEDIEKYRSKYNNTDFARSVACYANQEHQDKEPMLMGITIDLDGDSLEASMAEARRLRDYLYDVWDLKKEEVRFYYSGNRSIHIEIQPETLGINPHERLHLYIKEVVRGIADMLELEFIDYNLYATRHLYRYIGAIHSKTGKYKTEIDPSELNLSPSELMKLGEIDKRYLYREALELTINETAARCFSGLYETAKKGIDESSVRASTIESLSLLKGIVKYPACIQDLLQGGLRVKGTRNRAMLTLLSFLKDIGKTEADAVAELTPWAKAIPSSLTNTSEAKRITDLETIARFVFSDAGKDYHFACPFIISLGDEKHRIACKQRCQLRLNKEARKLIYSTMTTQLTIPIAYLPEVGGYLTELIYDPVTKTTAFAIYDPKIDKVTYANEIPFEYPKVYVPYIDENVLKKSVLLPSGAEDYGTEENLYQEVADFIAKYYNEPEKYYRTLNTCYVFFTWVYDRFRSWCYLQFLGSAGGGKTRALEAIGHICYRPILLAGADSAACMLRMSDKFRGTNNIDEATFANKSEAHLAIVQMLNVGYKIDGTVGRCEGDDNRPTRYAVGSPKILATREDFYDDGLRSRCFVKRTGRDKRIKKGEHRQPFILPASFEEEALVIRNKLLLWRFRHWNDAELNTDLEIDGVASRINEIIIPILSVMHSDIVKDDIEVLAMAQQEDLRQQRQSSLEGEILKVIKEMGLTSGDVQPSDIRDKINEKREDKFISTHRVTNILKKLELNLHKYGNRYMITASPQNMALLKELYEDYDLTESASDVQSDITDHSTEEDDISFPGVEE